MEVCAALKGRVFAPFRSIDLAHFCLISGMVSKGTTGVYELIRELEMDFKKSFP